MTTHDSSLKIPVPASEGTDQELGQQNQANRHDDHPGQ